MKHARKTVLLDINSPKVNEKQTEPLTNAINSLVNATEFNRANFGDRAKTVTELNKDLNEILDRKDLSLDERLKLYNQSLTRYLFLQHESKKPIPAIPKVEITPVGVTPASSVAGERTPSMQSDYDDDDDEEEGAVGGKEDIITSTPKIGTPRESSGNSYTKEILRTTKTPKFKSNLPRATPKYHILRKERADKRMSDYFVGWKNRK